jgi:hypothetical protein
MNIRISACTDRAFAESLMPMAFLTSGSACAVNDNSTQVQFRWRIRLHWRHDATSALQAVS